MSLNTYKLFQDLLPRRPLEVGTVVAVDGGQAIVELPGGGRITARGDATVGGAVFVRDGLIEGQAPVLTVVPIDV